MKLTDEIMDVAQEMALNMILNDPSDHTIIDAVSEIVGVKLAYNSVGARLALATYNRNDIRSMAVAS
jgi:hypothetical protein